MSTSNATPLLTRMIRQFAVRHGKNPKKIVIQPSALLALAVKRSVGPVWDGIPVECRDLVRDEAAEKEEAANMGVFLRPCGLKAEIIACDLK
jgi:hypothetical protein